MANYLGKKGDSYTRENTFKKIIFPQSKVMVSRGKFIKSKLVWTRFTYIKNCTYQIEQISDCLISIKLVHTVKTYSVSYRMIYFSFDSVMTYHILWSKVRIQV